MRLSSRLNCAPLTWSWCWRAGPICCPLPVSHSRAVLSALQVRMRLAACGIRHQQVLSIIACSRQLCCCTLLSNSMANQHYGKIGDVWKHLPLAEILGMLKPTEYWESHAGSTRYPLSAIVAAGFRSFPLPCRSRAVLPVGSVSISPIIVPLRWFLPGFVRNSHEDSWNRLQLSAL